MIKRGDELTLTISDFAFGGNGIAKIPSESGDYVMFVANAFPGQKVQVRVTKKRKKYAECSLLTVLERSPDEVLSDFQEISGAPYIFVPIHLQEEYKRKVTLDVYRKLGGIKDIESYFDTFISSPIHHFYRNKMEYSFSTIAHDLEKDMEIDGAFALGFKRRGTWWKVENLDKASGLFDEEWETFLKSFRLFLASTGLPAWHPPRKEGFYRHIVVRKSFNANQLLVNLVTSSQGIENFNLSEVGAFLQENMGHRIAGFQHTINDNVADRAKIENGATTLVFGNSVIEEKLLGLRFEISMESFFQTNPKSAELLYAKALEYVFEDGNSLDNEIVLDLFCGTGTIGQILASKNPTVKVVGVDIVEEAISDAKRNAQKNNLSTVSFVASDVGKFLYNFPEYQGKIKTLVLDPPRAGIAPKTLQKVIALNAKRIVYISCNPSTQARDANTLITAGYALKKLSLVDQFPHTSHIEAVTLFEKE